MDNGNQNPNPNPNGVVPQDQLIIPQSTPPERRSALNIKMFLIFFVIVLVLLLAGALVYFLTRSAPPPPPPVQKKAVIPTPTIPPPPPIVGMMTYIQDGNLYINNNGQVKQLTTDASFTRTGATIDTPALYYAFPSISPDGTKVVYFQISAASGGKNQENISLYISNLDGTGRLALINNGKFDPNLSPVQWFNDGQNIAIGMGTNAVIASDKSYSAFNLVKFNVVTGNLQKITSYSILQGCGSSSFDPSHLLAGQEGAVLLYTPTFKLSSDNNYFINNANCAGYGINIHNLQTNASASATLGDTISQSIFSPDGKEIASVSQDNKIQLINPKTGNTITSLNTSVHPESLYWSPDGKTIYYGAYSVTKTINAQADSLGNSLQGEHHTASLWSISTTGSNEKKLQDYEAYAIKPFYVAPDDSKAYLLVVENPDAYIEKLNKVPVNDLTPIVPQVDLIEANIASSSSEIISRGTENAYYLSGQ